MKKTFLISLLLLHVLCLSAQSLSFNKTLKGIVVKQNSGHQVLSNVLIEAQGANPVTSQSDGYFSLVFYQKMQGETAAITASLSDYEVVNSEALRDVRIPANAERQVIKIVMCHKQVLADNRRKYFNIAYDASIAAYKKKSEELRQQLARAEIDQATYNRDINLLQEQNRNAEKQANELAERFSRINLDDASELYRRAFAKFEQGDVDGAIKILDEADFPQIIKEVRAEEAAIRFGEKDSTERANLLAVVRDTVIKAYLLEAIVHKEKDNASQAKRNFEKALKLDSANLSTLSLYATFWEDKADTLKAITYYQQMVRHSKNSTETIAWLLHIANQAPTLSLAENSYHAAMQICEQQTDTLQRAYTTANIHLLWGEKYLMQTSNYDHNKTIALQHWQDALRALNTTTCTTNQCNALKGKIQSYLAT